MHNLTVRSTHASVYMLTMSLPWNSIAIANSSEKNPNKFVTVTLYVSYRHVVLPL